jgi:hypothetical protein
MHPNRDGCNAEFEERPRLHDQSAEPSSHESHSKAMRNGTIRCPYTTWAAQFWTIMEHDLMKSGWLRTKSHRRNDLRWITRAQLYPSRGAQTTIRNGDRTWRSRPKSQGWSERFLSHQEQPSYLTPELPLRGGQ